MGRPVNTRPVGRAMKTRRSGGGIDWLLLMEDYQASYTEAYKADPKLHSLPYKVCAERLFSRAIYYGDAYIHALTSCGFSAEQVVPLCQPLQFKWADGADVWNPSEWIAKLPMNSGSPVIIRQLLDRWVLSRILAKQIVSRRPEFVWLFSGVPVAAREVRRWRRYTGHTLLWWSCPLWEDFPYGEFDLILAAIPSLIRVFEEQGIRAAYLPHAFDHRIIQRVPCLESRIPRVAFVGSLSPGHTDRISFLHALSRRVPIDFYGSGVQFLPKDSPLRHSYRGQAWGEDLYSVYGSYLVVVHRNIDVAGTSASAKRLFEAAGMGACVVTESSDGLSSLFAPGEEIVTYSDLEECGAKIETLLSDPAKARAIGQKAQARTLQDHTYYQRTRTLLDYLGVNQLQ